MHVEGEFERLVITETTLYGVPFIQHGFSFTAYIGLEYHPTIDEGNIVRGYVDGDLIAIGTLTSLAPITRNGRDYIRLCVDPKSPHDAPIQSL